MKEYPLGNPQVLTFLRKEHLNCSLIILKIFTKNGRNMHINKGKPWSVYILRTYPEGNGAHKLIIGFIRQFNPGPLSCNLKIGL